MKRIRCKLGTVYSFLIFFGGSLFAHAQTNNTDGNNDWIDALRPPDNQMTFLDGPFWAERDWQRGKPIGRSYADARKAFELNTYKASDIVHEFDLTSDQEFELAKMAAEKQGGAYSEHIVKFRRLTEQQRYDSALLAAQKNHWANVEFNIDNVRLSSYEKRLALYKVALFRSSYQIRFVKKWGFPKNVIFECLLQTARQSVFELLHYRKEIEEFTTEEFKRLILETTKGRYVTDAMEAFQVEWFPTYKDRLEVAGYFAEKNIYFVDHIGKFVLLPEDEKRLLEVNRKVPKTRLLKELERFGFSDREILETYFELRNRDDLQSLIREKDQTEFIFFESSNPIWLIDRIGGFTFPDFERPGFEDPFRIVTTQIHADGHVETYDSKVADMEREDLESVDDILAFAKAHPDLLPEKWVSVAFEPYRKRVLVGPLLRSAYRLSSREKMFDPKHSLDIACQAAGLRCGDRKLEDYSRELGMALLVELLSLQLKFPLPAFTLIAVEPELLNPSQVRIFIKFLHELRMRVHHDAENEEYQEFDRWLRLRSSLGLVANGITRSNIQHLIRHLKKRPKPHHLYSNLPTRCQDVIHTLKLLNE